LLSGFSADAASASTATGKIQAKILSLIATITSQKRTKTDTFRENNPIDELVVAQT
jgi:hypothetical protein